MASIAPSCRSDSVRVCRICFTVDVKLYLMTAYKVLYKEYETLTGFLIGTEDTLPPYLCTECSQQLLKCAHFKSRALRAHSILHEVIKKHNCITLESLQSVTLQQGLSSNLTHNQTDQLNDINMDVLEKANNLLLYVDKQRSPTHMPGSSNDTPDSITDCIKTEISDIDKDNDNVINQDNYAVIKQEIVKDEATTNNSIVHTPRLHGDTVFDSVKKEFTNADDMSEDKVADSSSDDSHPLAEVRHEAKPSATADQAVNKLDPRRIPDGGPLVGEQLSRDICHNETANGDHSWSPSKAPASSNSLASSCNNNTTARRVQVTYNNKQSGGKPFPCKMCSKAFVCNKDLQNHMRIHSSKKSYSCDVCGKAFSWNAHLQKHMRKHFAEKSYSCDVCGKAFRRNTELQVHLRIHSGERPYSCDICKKAFTQISTRQKHMEIHSGKKSYSCDICKKAFTQISTRQKHMEIHSAKKSYTCDICKKVFANEAALEKHLLIHSREKPYSCDICKKEFTEKRNLRRHLRIHSGETPYKCGDCKKAFTRFSHLQRHVMQRHVIHSG